MRRHHDDSIPTPILKEQAAGWNLDVSEATDGPHALQMLARAAEEDAPFDLVILDYQMPHMDGAMVAKRIRDDDQLRSTKIIMLSSADGSVNDPEIAALKLEGHLVKPARSAVLLESVTNILLASNAKSLAATPTVTSATQALHANKTRKR